MRVSATDRDNTATPNAQLKYSLGIQIPDKHNVPLFQINADTGEISTTEEGNHTHVQNTNPNTCSRMRRAGRVHSNLSIPACNLAV